MQTLVAHHLIAVLFSSVQYATSPCMKSTQPVQHTSYNRNSFFPTSLTLSSLPVQMSLSSAPSSPHCNGSLLLRLYFDPCVCISLLLFWSPPPNLFPWLVLSLVQMCPWSAVAWLGDNRSDFETGGMAALLSLTQSYSDEPSTAKGRQRKEK